MYVDSSKTILRGKEYWRHLLRNSYRDQDGKVKHETLGNISRAEPEEIEAIRLALRHKGDLSGLLERQPSLRARQGGSVGAVWTLYELARHLGIQAALGPTTQGRLALWQVMARALDQGSRLSAVRLATSHCAAETLALKTGFSEDDLYANLDWLAQRQAEVEKRLFQRVHAQAAAGGLFLYDVTSSYLEGMQNELADWGYNRDGKRGKKQIVIGLLTLDDGDPVSIEVFHGNTTDPKTFGPQIQKVLERFDARGVTFVGDRGMIKSEQIEALGKPGFHFITAITKPQIQKLLKQGLIQLDLFDQGLAEVTDLQGVRYVLRRNPARAAELEAGRQDKLAVVRRRLKERNDYLREHRRARPAVALRFLQEQAARLRIESWVRLSSDPENRCITLGVDETALAEECKLDGCYVLKTDLPAAQANKQIVHDRYRDLMLVEQAFRTCKSVELEVRPIYVRLASRTRGHVFVVMLAYCLVRELAWRWRHLDLTVQEGLDQLGQLCATEIVSGDRTLCCQIPEPRPALKLLLEAAKVHLPDALPGKGVIVATKRKLPERRTQR
jgi:hypothetical protein